MNAHDRDDDEFAEALEMAEREYDRLLNEDPQRAAELLAAIVARFTVETARLH